jgi:hypothetical protein
MKRRGRGERSNEAKENVSDSLFGLFGVVVFFVQGEGGGGKEAVLRRELKITACI